jgi:hypothetical protein
MRLSTEPDRNDTTAIAANHAAEEVLIHRQHPDPASCIYVEVRGHVLRPRPAVIAAFYLIATMIMSTGLPPVFLA